MRQIIKTKEPERPSTKLSQTLVAADVRRLKIPPLNLQPSAHNLARSEPPHVGCYKSKRPSRCSEAISTGS